MPGVASPGNIAITVSSTTYNLMVDPNSYSQVDIVDFAPRVSGTPTLSTLGLYVDVAQESFAHGFGQWEFTEPASYAHAGDKIDTRHGYISLFSNRTEVFCDQANWEAYRMVVATQNVPVFATLEGIGVIKPSDGSLGRSTTLGALNDVLFNGKYLFFSRTGRMQVAWIGLPSSVDATSATFTGAAFEDTNQWASGVAWVFDGTGAGNETAITASDGTSVTVASWTGTQPDATSYIMLWNNTGNAGNTPTGYGKMAVFGGSMWAYEKDTHFLHFWSETNGSDAEGNGATDAAVTLVGPPGGTIVNLFPFENQLYVFREDGVWTINEQDTDALAYHTLDFQGETSSSNFKTVLAWQGFLIFPVRNRLFKYRSGLQDITPPPWNEDPPYKQFGNFSGLAVRGSFLYVLGQSNAAVAGENFEATTGFVGLLATDGVGWHKLWDVAVTTPTTFNCWLDPAADELYITAYKSSLGHLWTIPLQTYSDLPYASYPTSGTHNLYTSYFNFGLKRIPKSFASLTLHGDFPTNTSVAAAYRVDDTAAWTALGTSFTTDMQEVSFPTALTGKRIQYRLTLATTAGASTPTVKAVITKLMLRPDVKYGVTCDVLVSDDLLDQNLRVMGLTGAQIKTALEAARDSVSPITFVDIYNTSHSAYLASVRFSTIAYEGADAVQSVARCTFVFV